jgi:hypothetical protein
MKMFKRQQPLEFFAATPLTDDKIKRRLERIQQH